MGELAEESCRTGKELYSTFVEVHNAVESFEANHSIFIGQVAEQNEKIKEVFEQHKALKEPCAQLEESLYRASKEQDGLGNVTAELEDDAKNMGVLRPPFVNDIIWSNTMRKFFVLSTRLIVTNGITSGNVTFQNCFHLPAPSSMLAS